MDLTVLLPPSSDRRWTIAQQLGIDTAVVRFWGEEEWWTHDSLLRTRTRFEDHGFSLDVVEDRPPMEKTVLGKPGRDEEIEIIKQLIRNMGKVDIGTYCWVWTENPLGVLRTSDSVPDRGGSLQSGYNHEWMERADDHPEADITEADLWENLKYFLEEVVPVAEEAGVNMALHPDDPPINEPVRARPQRGTDAEIASVGDAGRQVQELVFEAVDLFRLLVDHRLELLDGLLSVFELRRHLVDPFLILVERLDVEGGRVGFGFSFCRLGRRLRFRLRFFGVISHHTITLDGFVE